jgi:hypothetical protein
VRRLSQTIPNALTKDFGVADERLLGHWFENDDEVEQRFEVQLCTARSRGSAREEAAHVREDGSEGR